MSTLEQITEQLDHLTDEEILELECHIGEQRCLRQLTESCLPPSFVEYLAEQRGDSRV